MTFVDFSIMYLLFYLINQNKNKSNEEKDFNSMSALEKFAAMERILMPLTIFFFFSLSFVSLVANSTSILYKEISLGISLECPSGIDKNRIFEEIKKGHTVNICHVIKHKK